jgi:hypothetical protein
MLQNPMYIGSMAQGKTKRISYKTKKCVRIDRQHWKVVENTHEPIVEREIFDKVAALVASRKSTRSCTYDHILKGIIRCHECGYPLAVVNRPNTKGKETLYFICRTYQRFAKGRACTCHSAKVEDVTQAVLERVGVILNRYLDAGKLELLAAKKLEDAQNKDATAAKTYRMKSRVESLTAALDRVYMDKLAGVLDEEDFMRIYSRLKEERTALESKLLLHKSDQQAPKEKQRQIKRLVERFMNMQGCNRALIVSLVEKVEMTEDKQILVYFRFRPPEPENHLQ